MDVVSYFNLFLTHFPLKIRRILEHLHLKILAIPYLLPWFDLARSFSFRLRLDQMGFFSSFEKKIR